MVSAHTGSRIAQTVLALVLCTAAVFVALTAVDVDDNAAHADGDCLGCDGDDDDPPPPPEGGTNSFSGQAALFTPDGHVVDSGEGPSCPGCEWRTEPDCRFGGQGQACNGLWTCGPRNEDIYINVFLRKPGIDWEEVDRVCLEEGEEMLSTEDVGEQVEEQWIRYVPEQRLTVQPPDGTALVNMPMYFDSNQPTVMPEEEVSVLGFTIRLMARGEWEWTFEPGVTREFHVPGSRYDDPNPEVQYTYQTTGKRQVVLNTRWWGSFRVGEYGPYDIEDPATQTSDPIPINVLETGGVLTD